MLYRLKTHLKTTTVLAALVVAALLATAFVIFLTSQVQNDVEALQSERATLEVSLNKQRLLTAAETLKTQNMRDNVEKSRQQFENDRQDLSVGSLATAARAAQLQNQIIDFALSNDLTMAGFQKAESVTTISKEGALTFIDKSMPGYEQVAQTCPAALGAAPPTDDIQLNTVTYAFTTSGGRDSLILLINLAGDTPTSRFETLSIERDEDDHERWTMRVCMHVPYGEG